MLSNPRFLRVLSPWESREGTCSSLGQPSADVVCACVRGVRATAAERQLVKMVIVAKDQLIIKIRHIQWQLGGGKWPGYGCVIILEVIVLRVTFFTLLNTRGHESMFLQREKCFASMLKHCWNPVAFMMSKPIESGISLQHQRISQAGRQLWKSFSPTPCSSRVTWSRWSCTMSLVIFISSFDLPTWSD